MQRSGSCWRLASLVVPVLVAVLPVSADRHADVTPFSGKVDAIDVVGGYASTHVIVQARAGVEPAVLADGRRTFLPDESTQRGKPEFQLLGNALAVTLEQWQTTEITPTLQFELANQALADTLGLNRSFTIRVPKGTDTQQMAKQLATFTELFERADVDGIGGILQTFPNDPSFNQQYGLHNTGQTIQGQVGVPGADINAAAAWDIHTGTDDIIIAIVDTGIATAHPEFSGKLVTGYNSIDGSSNVGDSPIIPHGTHVSGIAAANTNNGAGIAGVSWDARIMPVKVLGLFGGGTETNIANGVLWAADNGAHIINMSLGVPDGIPFFENACQYAYNAGVLVVAASGNTPGALIPPPAKWPTVMAVGATNNQDQLASFTTTGPEMTVTAPGASVYSTWMGLFGNLTYSFQSGTSMAAPHVAGLAALIWSANLDLTNQEVWDIIEATADDKGTPGWNPQFGHGRINAYEALLAAIDTPECAFADLNCDGIVDVFDLILLINEWGPCADPDDCTADLTGDGEVDVFDLIELINNWG